MSAANQPYSERETVPLYFFPFLSTRSSHAQKDDVERFFGSLDKCGPARQGDQTLVYLHIPFCRNICSFCGFYRQVSGEHAPLLERYVDRLIAELQCYARKDYVAGRRIDAIYVGGGTPTVLPPKLIAKLAKALRKNLELPDGVEFSFEGEVRTLKDPERLAILREVGCTRVSFGVQSFEPRVRKLSGLVPSLADIEDCMEEVRRVGYDVNIDLMYGLPGQSEDIWLQDVKRAIDLGCANVDFYDTVLYPHTTLFARRHKLKGELAGETVKLDMLRAAIGLLEQAGYAQETVEDFAKPQKGYRMKRLVYGGGNGRSEVIALGASAVGQLNGHAYRNLPPDEYQEWQPDDLALPVQLRQTMAAEDYAKRALVFFPKLLGLNKADLPDPVLQQHRPVFESMKERGLVVEDETTFRPTRLGLLWTDNMAMEFLANQERRRIWKIGS